MRFFHLLFQAVLQLAVDVGADSAKFPDTWLFHQKWGAGKKGPVPRLEGNKIEYIQVGGRTTAFVPALQKLMAQAVSASRKATDAKKSKATNTAPENGSDAPAPATKLAKKKRAAPSKPKAQAATGMLGNLSRRLLHIRVII